jgi:L-galactose dehydrogenase
LQYKKLGDTGVDVSLLSYGTGGPSKFGQATGVDDAGRARLVSRALELGVNLFDTAEAYGESEAMLGRAIKGHARDSFLIATKWSYRLEDGIVTDPDVIVKSLEQSLDRMQTDYVDIFQIHGMLPHQYDELAEGYIEVMQKLQKQGKTRFLGVTQMLTMDTKNEAMSTAMDRHPDVWDSVMFKYGIMNQWPAKRSFPLAKSSKTGILNMAPVRLTLTRPEKLNERMTEWGDNDGENALNWLSGGDSSELIRKGYQFAAQPPEVTTVISGTSSIAHLESNIAALDGTLTDEEFAKLKSGYGDSASPD